MAWLRVCRKHRRPRGGRQPVKRYLMDNSAHEQAIRDAIFEHGIFAAGQIGNWQVRPDAFRRHEAAWRFETADIEAELRRMQAAGLVTCNEAGFWHALPAGLVARETRWQTTGRRHRSLGSGRAAVDDLVLAIVMSGGWEIHPDEPPQFPEHELAIYLARVSPAECERTTQSLVERGLLTREIDWDDFRFNGVPLRTTPDGDRYYAQQVVPRLGLTLPATILAPAVDEHLPFDELGLSPVVADNLRFRWEEAARCVGARAWLAAATVYGSILELVLLDWLRRDQRAATMASAAPKDNKTRQVLPIDDWSSAALIKVAAELRYLDPSLARHANAVRDTRNLIHPDRHIRERSAPDGDVVQITRHVVQAVLQALARATRET